MIWDLHDQGSKAQGSINLVLTEWSGATDLFICRL